MRTIATREGDTDTFLVAQMAGLVSVFTFLVYLRNHEILLYGDAIAHINIARRVFDSRTPGLLQLGTVWLPLPHLLMVPFLASNWLWQTGIGGSIPSMVAYILGVVGIFRLARFSMERVSASPYAARAVAWGTAVIYGANPNLLYVQSTAMTESVYLALFVWSLVYFAEFVAALHTDGQVKKATSALFRCGWCIAGACLTRYDGWFLAGIIFWAALAVLVQAKKLSSYKAAFAKFALIAAAAPVLWIAYNAVVYRNPLEFANGPYSAIAIEQKTAMPGFPPHPGTDNLSVAASYFLKAAELTLLPNIWHRLWLALLAAGTIMILISRRRFWPLLLFWAPLPFYMLSIAYSGVPIFLPPWWPHSIYNARYGLQMLPAFAVLVPLTAYFVTALSTNVKLKLSTVAAFLILVATSYTLVWHSQPILFQEAWINSQSKNRLEDQLAKILMRLPNDSNYLMYLGSHVGVMEDAGIPLNHVINEGNHRPWEKPLDPDGLWERALADPHKYVQYVIAFKGDDVDQQVDKQSLTSLMVLHVEGQDPVTIYATSNQPR